MSDDTPNEEIVVEADDNLKIHLTDYAGSKEKIE
jgi:hypothetical protein